MTNPKELENHICTFNDGECKCDCFIAGALATLTSQLEAIPEDENLEDQYDKEELELVSKIFGDLKTPEYMQERRYGKNQERQRQRQALQLAINEWTELK